MEYFIIFCLQIIGVGLNANRKIVELDTQFKDVPFKEIKAKFLKNERVTFIGSGLLLLLHLLVHLIVDLYYPQFRETNIPLFIADWSVPYIVASFIIAFFVGYFGQWLAYKLLGKAGRYIEDKTK